MTTRRKLNLINGTMDAEGDIRTYQTINNVEVHCEPYTIAVPPLPFPNDDDDWDDFDQADDRDK